MGRSGGSESFMLLLGFVGLVVLVGEASAAYPTVERLRSSRVVRNHIFAAVSALPPASNALSPTSSTSPSRVYHVTDYGADPTGKSDATAAIMRAFSDAFQPPSDGRDLLAGIADLGGAEIDFDGGSYEISSPIRLPSGGRGNVKIHGGSLRASGDFPTDGYLIEMRAVSSTASSTGDTTVAATVTTGLDYEYITLRDLMLDSNYRGGGIAVINSLRTTIDNCYITHFTSDGILVQGGHETYIRNSYLGQHITSGGDPGEKDFTGVGINLAGNDNAVTDVVIFSAAIGVLVAGQANTLSGVHCYNKATGWGGTGIYLKLAGLTQTRILNCYLDFTGIVAEDPVQLLIASSFFLGDAYIVLKSVQGVMKGVTIVDNMFSGSDKGIGIVQLDESKGQFTTVEQVIVARNNVRGMALRSTTGKGSVQANGSSTWTVDFSSVLLFPNRIEFVQYTLATEEMSFPVHALRNSSDNKVVVQSATPVSATVNVFVDQSVG